MKDIKDLTQYHWKALTSIFDFLRFGDEEVLLNGLQEIGDHYKKSINDENSDKYIWFRFFKDDPSATSINDIRNDLHSPNREYRMECMKICCDNAYIEVYYS